MNRACRCTHSHIFIARVVTARGICKPDYGGGCVVSITDILVIVEASKVATSVPDSGLICPFSQFFLSLINMLLDCKCNVLTAINHSHLIENHFP